MKPTLFATASLAIVSAIVVPGVRAAETLIIPYSHSWQYMHPMGISPAQMDPPVSHPNFDATWWLAVQDFVADYDGPAFGGETFGTPGSYTTMDGGLDVAPFGYGNVDNWLGINGAAVPLLIPQESPSSPVTDMGKQLTIPTNPYRRTAYFRTTFDLPQALSSPVIRCMMDDGAAIFLDGVQVARMNLKLDTLNENGLPIYTTVAAVDPASPNQTENTLYTINLGQAGMQASSGTLQSEVLNTVTLLSPGIHTLAVCVVNVSPSSPDLLMALQMTANDGGINPVASNFTRDTHNTPLDPGDDTFGFDVMITQTSGEPGHWQSTNPQHPDGTYGTSVTFTGFPVGGPAEVHFNDEDSPSVTALLTVPPPPPPLWIGQITLPGIGAGPLLCTSETAPEWVQIGAETVLQTNAGGSPHLLESALVNIPATGAAFSGILEIEDNSALGNFESNDSVEAVLILNNGEDTIEVNLLPASFDRNSDHMLTGFSGVNYNSNVAADELNPAGLLAEASYVEGIALSAVIPPGTDSARFVVRAVNNNVSEFFRIKSARFAPAGTIADLDNDGVSDADELAAGTNPLNASSRFFSTHNLTGNNLAVSFPTMPNRVYRVLTSTNMLVWSPENVTSITGDGSLYTLNVSTAAQRKYITVQSGRGLNPWP